MAFTTEIAFSMLEQARRDERLGHAYLITGLSSEERLEFARKIVAFVNHRTTESLMAMAPDGVIVVEPESKSRRITVEQIRSLEHVLVMKAASGKTKCGVIVDCDRMNQQSTNAFLKTLEEPPPSSLLLLLTGAPEQLLDTVLSRCIKVPLFAPGRVVDPEARPEVEKKLLASLAAHFKAGVSPARALALQKVFAALLASEKGEIEDKLTAQAKAESAKYKETTGVQNWAKEREDYFKAMIESQYRKLRARLHEVLLLWFGDMLRLQTGIDRLEFPEHIASLQAGAKAFETPDLLKRLAAIEQLGTYFDTNVSEALAMEMTFLGAYS